MREFLIVAAKLVLVGAGLAAPIPSMAAPPVPVSNWTGLYVGANFGGGWGSQSSTGTVTTYDLPAVALPLVASGNSNMHMSGILGGVQIGYNYQVLNNWLLGIEADMDASNIRGSTIGCPTVVSDPAGGLPPGTVSGCGTQSSKYKYFGTVRGRVGHVWNDFMLYGTGGWAWGHATSDSNPLCGATLAAPCPGVGAGPIQGDTFSFSKTFNGWAAGAGVEWQFIPNWTLRLEYLHLQFPEIKTNGSSPGSQGGISFIDYSDSKANTGIDIVRVGLNYRFNWTAFPVAR